MTPYHKQFQLHGKTIFEKMVFTPPYKVNNSMPNEACFLYLEDGAYEINAPQEHVTIHSKDAVLMRCGSYVTEFLKTVSSNTCEVTIVHLYPDVLKKVFEHELSEVITSIQKSPHPIAVNKYVNDELFKIYIDSLNIYFANPSLVNDNLITLKLKELIILLTRTENAESIAQLISSLFSQNEYSFREIVEAHLFTEFSIDKMSILTHLSVSSFKREFTKIFHDSPARYVKHKKLERAAALLAGTSQRISDIAFDCGFNDLSHFSRSFQEKYGISPSRYKLDQKNKSLS